MTIFIVWGVLGFIIYFLLMGEHLNLGERFLLLVLSGPIMWALFLALLVYAISEIIKEYKENVEREQNKNIDDKSRLL